jgi:hypothetical protein
MQQIQSSYRGLALLFNLNWDGLLWIAAIWLGLGGGVMIGTMLTEL